MKITFENIHKGIRYLKHYGFKEFLIRLKEKSEPEEISYMEWFVKHKVSKEELKLQKKVVCKLLKKPIFYNRYIFSE